MIPVSICRWVHQQQASVFQAYFHRFYVTHLAPRIPMLQYKVSRLPERQRCDRYGVVQVFLIISVLTNVIGAILVPVDEYKIVTVASLIGNKIPQVLEKRSPWFGRKPGARKCIGHSFITVGDLLSRYRPPLAIDSDFEQVSREVLDFGLQPPENIVSRGFSEKSYVV